MANRVRNIRIEFRVTEDEHAFIAKKMSEAGIINREAYLRKMAIEGYIIRVDYSDIREMSRLLRIATNLLNQIAKRANESRSLYASDIKDLQDSYEEIRRQSAAIKKKLAGLPG